VDLLACLDCVRCNVVSFRATEHTSVIPLSASLVLFTTLLLPLLLLLLPIPIPIPILIPISIPNNTPNSPIFPPTQPVLQRSILPIRLLPHTRLPLPLPLRPHRHPALRPFLRNLQLLRQQPPRDLPVLRTRARGLRFDDQARGEVLELHGGGGFVLLWGVSEAGLEGGGVGKRGFGGGGRKGGDERFSDRRARCLLRRTLRFRIRGRWGGGTFALL